MEYVVERTDKDAIAVRMQNVKEGWKQTFLLLSDIHFDSPHCNRVLLKELLDDAVSCGAGIFIIGDLLDIMQLKSDKRGSKSQIRAEYKDDDYVNRVIDDVVEFLMPYKDNIIFISVGNHESAILKYIEYDLLASVCRRLGVIKMGYAGFAKFMFSQCNNKGKRYGRKMHFDHGTGGGGEITKGVMRAQREAAKVEADIYVGGHYHESWYVELRRVRLNEAGKVQKDTEIHISIPGFKDEYDLGGGYHIEKGRSPRPQGGFWMEFRWKKGAPGSVGHRYYKAD